MTLPALAAKAREIAEAHTEPFTAVVTDRSRPIGYFGARPGSPRMVKDSLEAAILSALIDADAAATERCALAATVRARELRRAATPGAFPIADAFDDFAAAIRGQP